MAQTTAPRLAHDPVAIEAQRRHDLARTKRYATSALALALLGLIWSLLQGATGAWGWLRAFCEAAAVGALADWFAVTALFRHPLGLPIPHTALIPAGKPRIADGVAHFVRDQFLSPEMLMGKLRAFNPAASLAQWLRAPKHVEQVTRQVQSLAREGVALLDEERVRQALTDFVVQRAQRWDAAATGADVLKVLTQDGRHHALLDDALSLLRNYLSKEETRDMMAQRMVAYVRGEWPKVIAIVDAVYNVERMAGHLSERLARQLMDEVQQALEDRGHQLRQAYEGRIDAFITRLQQDPAFIARTNAIKDRIVDHADVRQYVGGLWQAAHQALAADLSAEDSRLMRHLGLGLRALADRVATDPALADTINQHALDAATRIVNDLRDGVSDHIASTIRSWDERKLVDQLELSVGRDLQYIRLNGTLVGGLIGLGLHALMLLVTH